ncbi:hypothetical protein H4R35_003799 [Dimargaris xerosporica]|nr:hypothetical protein H4R35_003799 [Dimargaris xerosporica]
MSQYIVFSLEPAGTDSYSPFGRRYRQSSCKRCRARKKGCDGREPCQKCVLANTACEYGFSKRMPTKRPGTPLLCSPPRPSTIPPVTVGTPTCCTTPPPDDSTDLHNVPGLALSPVSVTPSAGWPDGPGAATHSSPILVEPLVSFLEAAVRRNDPIVLRPETTTLTSVAVAQRVGLKSNEEQIYNPCLVISMVTIFVNQQTRIFRDLYLQRLYRKLKAGQIPPLTLNVLLAFAASVARSHDIDISTRKAAIMVYYERADKLLMGELDRPTIETPYLLLLMAGASMVVDCNETFVYYSGLSKRLLIQLNIHLADASTAEAPGTYTTTAPPPSPHDSLLEESLVREYKRRVYWSIATHDNLISCLMGISSALTTEPSCVSPINDTLVEQILRCDPSKDHYPIVIPGINYTLMGYPYITKLATLIAKVSELRIQAQDNAAMDIAQYHRLNAELLHWYDALPSQYRLPDQCPGRQEIATQPIHYESLYSLHSYYYVTVILLNCYNLFLGSVGFHPEKDPTCLKAGFQAAEAFTAHCLPYYNSVSEQYHTLSTVAYVSIPVTMYVVSLTGTTPEERKKRMATINRYLAFLKRVQANCSHTDVFIRVLQSQLPPDLHNP